MSQDPPSSPETAGSEPTSDTPPLSDLEASLASFGRAVSGVAGRLLGPKALGLDTLPDGPAISAEADAAVEHAGEVVGRLLHRTGTALKEHPLDAANVVKHLQEPGDEVVPAEPGWSPLVGGLKTLGEGVAASAESLLDKVAPRKPRDEPHQ